MRVIVDCTPLSKGGGVQVAVGFIMNLARSGEQWLAIIPSQIVPHLPSSISGCSNILVVTKAVFLDYFRINRFLENAVRDFKPDVVFTVFGPPYFLASTPHVCGFALPNMIYPATPPLQKKSISELILDQVRRAILRRMDHVIVETQTVKSKLNDLLGVKCPALNGVGNAVNPILVGYVSSNVPRTKPIGLSRILVPSAYYRHKNLELLPEICAFLVRKLEGRKFTVSLTIPIDSPGWLAIKERAVELGVDSLIETLGELSLERLAEVYKDCDCVLLPTLREVSTAVYPESFFFNKPLVTSDLEFARELCGDAALYAAANDAEAFADCLIDVLSDPAVSASLVAKGAHQLIAVYPTPEEKFRLQMDVLGFVSKNSRHASH